MFGTIRKHQTWLWAVIIAVTIVSFVIFFSPASSSNSSGRRVTVSYGSIGGERITEDEFNGAYREAGLRYYFARGEWPDKGAKKTDFDVEHETYQRLFLVRKLKEYDIQVDSDSVAKMAGNILRDYGRGKRVTFAEFTQRALAPYATAEDFERFIRHDLGIQQLFSVVGLSGKLVTPPEAQSLYVREHEELATEAVFFSGSNYLAGVTTAPPEALEQFYTNRMPDYRLPEYMQVSYVKFDATNFLAEANREMAKLTNLNAIVERIYQERGTNYYREAKSPEEARQRIREDIRKELEITSARKQANEFASELFNKEPAQPENLAALAKEKGLAVKVTGPFDEENGPAALAVGPNFTKAAFSLSPTNKPFADDPLVGEDGVYVIAFDKEIPSAVPPLDKIRDRVTADCKYSQAVLLARQAGAAFMHTLTNGFAQGKSFFAICADAKVKPVTVPPFSLSTQELPEVEDQLSLYQFKQITFTTPLGKTSDFNPTREGGVVVYVQQRLPIDQSKMRADMPDYFNRVRQQRERDACNDWFNREWQKVAREIPLAQPKPSALTSGKAKR